ncbi:MAG: TonB-dependent receptor [Candidatus Synoicihabitans palmerolidicus]|nr:TonB-dependent receptor [Candidatus Synoicihabitans palmerolidicus]
MLADHSANPVSPQVAADYFTNVRHSFNRGVQKEGNVRVLGELFNLPAGPMRLSAAGKFQNWTFDSGQNFRGSDAYSQLVHGVAYQENLSSSEASRDIVYGALELSVPIFGRDWRPLPLLQSWEIQASLSLEESSTEGVNSDGEAFVNDQSADSNVVATKLQFTPDIVIRGSYSEGFYPPNWSDVSLPSSTTILPGFFADPKRGNTRQFTPNMTITMGGNPGLEPETAESFNAGLILTLRFLPNFSLNLDFWSIEKANAIVSQSFVAIIANPEAFGFLTTREEPTAAEAEIGWLGRITEVDSRTFNASITRTKGADVRLRYCYETGDLGTFSFNANATFPNNFDLLATPTAPMVDQAGGAGP